VAADRFPPHVAQSESFLAKTTESFSSLSLLSGARSVRCDAGELFDA